MNVLIIDHSSLFHQMLNDVFAESKMTPLISETVKEGLDRLQQQHFDFICVSLYLADGDGISLTQQIRSLPPYKHTPVILFTAEDSSDIYKQALSSGVTEVFHKRDIQQLLNFIKRFTLSQQPMQGRVLYVEDTTAQRQLLKNIFLNKNLEVDDFANAEEAWQAFQQHDYDLVVTDVVLEGSMTGMALINRIRRLDGGKGDVPILAVTGFDDISRRIELFYLGVTDYIIKPVIEEELLARVRNLIKAKQFHFEAITQRQRAETAATAKSDFITRMGHELRTPLNAVMGFAQLLEMDKASMDAPQQKAVGEIRQAGQLMLSLINDIFDISKIEVGKLDFNITDVNLAELVEAAVKQVKSFAEQNQIVIKPYTIPADLLVEADATRLLQVLLNLLTNAVKYNSAQGVIEILYQKREQGMVRLGIADSGIGMTKAQISKLFIPFDRLGRETMVEGTGLGLSIARLLLEGMNGEIQVESEPDKGTTFWIDLKRS